MYYQSLLKAGVDSMLLLIAAVETLWIASLAWTCSPPLPSNCLLHVLSRILQSLSSLVSPLRTRVDLTPSCVVNTQKASALSSSTIVFSTTKEKR
ncbi:hypothetical protein CPB85DRAFT_1321776 [Mucidula mucida]|nr:hypothetical protein CPB85DRAFT_1321776 [Mucidula mucida]